MKRFGETLSLTVLEGVFYAFDESQRCFLFVRFVFSGVRKMDSGKKPENFEVKWAHLLQHLSRV